MGIFRTPIQRALWIGALLVTDFTGMKPYEPRDHREEGLERSLFTDSKGEWVILGPKAPQKYREEKNKGEAKTRVRALTKETTGIVGGWL